MMKKRKRRQSPSFGKRKKPCPISSAGIVTIDYKDLELLKSFITERGKIVPRRITSVSTQKQKLLKEAIKRARHMALLPFVAKD